MTCWGRAGYDGRAGDLGQEGLLAATEYPPDLVLMDLQLPGIDGAETMRRLRGRPLAEDVPVVAVTAFAMAEDQANATRAGFDGYLEKPISVRALVGDVRGFLQGGRQ